MVAATMFASNVLHRFPDSKEITFTIVVMFSMAKANERCFGVVLTSIVCRVQHKCVLSQTKTMESSVGQPNQLFWDIYQSYPLEDLVTVIK